MKTNTTPTDIQSLKNDFYPTAYSLQLQAEELAAANAEYFEGYSEWSEDLEAIRLAEEETKAWDGAKPVTLDDGAQVLIKKACEHAKCPHHKCNRSDLRIGGIDI